MKLAILSDVHADARALAEALEQAWRLGCQRAVCAGDLVSYGEEPDEAVQLLSRHRIACVRGNHDRWAARDGRDLRGAELTEDVTAFLAALPPALALTVDGTRIAVCHARPDDDMRGLFDDTPGVEIEDYLDGLGVDVLIAGHTHIPLVRRFGGDRLLVNPGSTLRATRTGIEARASGTFGVLDPGPRRFTVHRIGGGPVVLP